MGVTRHPLFVVGGSPDSVPADRRCLRPLQQSLARALASGVSLLEDFYDRLFTRAPELRALFPPELGDLRCKLRASLALLLSPATLPDLAAAELARLARLHRALDIRPGHFALAARCLIEALATCDARAWSQELEREWAQALEALLASLATPT